MRRLIVFLATLTLTLLSVATATAAPGRQGPQPATLKAKTVATVGTPGSLVPVEGTLLDAHRRPVTGAAIVVTLAGAPSAVGHSLTGTGGTFEVFVPLPDEVPASGRVDLQVSFPGSAQVAASTLVLPVRVAPAATPADTELTVPAGGPAPAATLPAESGLRPVLPTSGSPFLDQLIVGASGLLAVMLVLFAMGAFLRRRRRS